jgi:TRAP-type C4-dicarboxylate transport system permease large subunit
MGVLVANAGILSNIFDLAARLTRRLPGGLGIATVLSAAGFSAVTGSSAATVVTLGRMCVTEMCRHGYRVSFAASIVAASGTLGVLIPPSIVLVIYGILTNESVGQLLLAAVIPGLLTAVAYIITVVVVSLRQRRADAADAATAAVEVTAGAGAQASAASVASLAVGTSEVGQLPDPVSVAEVGQVSPEPGPKPRFFISAREFEAVVYIGLIAVTVLGGIYGGIFTETEAGAIGALLALGVLLVRGRRTELGTWRALTSALQETAANTAMLVALLISGSIFTLFLVTTRVPQDLTSWIIGLEINRYFVIAIILVVLLMMGALLDGLSILLLTIPLTYPIVTTLGFDGLWYGILAVKMVEIGLLTPPFGLNVFMISGVVKEAQVESVFRGVVPFILAELTVVCLIVAFPELVTWLPSVAR